jgi:hypothetical protein
LAPWPRFTGDTLTLEGVPSLVTPNKHDALAPDDACAVCFGQTTTGLLLCGVPDFIVTMMLLMGVPRERALAGVEATVLAEYSCHPWEIPNHDMRIRVRLCADCAAKAEKPMEVGPADGKMPVYRHRGPMDWEALHREQ